MIDRTTKLLLLAIAMLLAVIALRPAFSPGSAQANPGGVASVIPLGIDGNSVFLLDGESGDLWMYTSDNRVYFKGRLDELGKPLAR